MNDLTNDTMKIQFYTDSELMSIDTDVIKYWKDDDDYGSSNKPHSKKPLGYFSLHFLNTDFMDIKSFKSFINEFGYIGLQRFSEYANTETITSIDSEKEYLCILGDFFDKSKFELSEAKNEYAQMIDYCINASGQEHLKGLSYSQRHYVGKKILRFTDITDNPYGSIFKNDVNIKHHSFEECISEDNLSEIELCNLIKTRGFDSRDTYRVDDFIAILNIEFQRMLKFENIKIRKCQNCSIYFFPDSRSDEVYCDNIHNGRSCKDIGYSNKVKKDVFMHEYRKAYKNNNHQKNHRKKNDPLLEGKFDKKFNEWVKNANTEMSIHKTNGELELFIKWLKKPINW